MITSGTGDETVTAALGAELRFNVRVIADDAVASYVGTKSERRIFASGIR
jgi:hypothetical protein